MLYDSEEKIESEFKKKNPELYKKIFQNHQYLFH